MVNIEDIISPLVGNDEQGDYLILLQEREKILVDRLCGSKYNREKHEFSRYKTRSKTIYTRFGKIRHNFVYVKNVESVPFSPLLHSLCILKNKHISDDFKQVLADKPSKMTYRKSSEDVLNSFNLPISSMTLHKYVKETSQYICAEEEEPNPEHLVLLADGTKVRGKGFKHEARSIVSIGDSGTQLLRQAINQSWREMSKDIDLSQYKVFVGDGEPGLASAMCTDKMQFHYCHEHAKRDLAFFLWKDGLCKKEYVQYTSKFESILHCLQNSTKKHNEDEDWQRLLWRINWAKKETNTLAVTLSCKGFHDAAGFLMRHKDHFMTAAEMAIAGIDVPWTTNIIERVMQEVGIRTKKKGMYWSEQGLDRILRIVLKRYFLPKERRNYKEVFAINNKEVAES